MAIFLSALAFLAGVMAVHQLPELPHPAWWSVCVLPIALSWRWPRFLPLVFFACGMAWTAVYAQARLADVLPDSLHQQTLAVDGVIASIPQRHDRRTRFDFVPTRATLKGKPIELPGRIRLTSYQTNWQPHAGEHWRLHVRLRRPHGFMNPGGFDYEAYLFANGIGATGYVVNKTPAERLPGSPGRYRLDRLREHIGQNIRALLHDHPRTGLLVALATGDRQGITPEGWRLLRRTGTSHLVAISGLHLTLVSGLVFLVWRRVWARVPGAAERLPAQQSAAIAALLAATGYAALAGFSIPTQRALIMLAVLYLALLRAMPLQRLRVLAIALLLVLVFDPLAPLSAGFWLSFTAVGVILLATQGRRLRGRWVEGMRLQWSVSLALIPATLYLFQSASLVSPLANFLAIPLFALLVVPLTLLSTLAMAVFPAAMAAPLFELTAGLAQAAWHGLTWLDGLGNFTLERAIASPWVLALAMAGVLILCLPRGWPGRWLGVLWCLPLFAPMAGPATGTAQVAVLDVGQGLSVVVQTARHTLVYDTGPRFSPRFDTGEAVVVPYLRQRGINRVDRLIISHGDTDHIGGAQSLIANLPVAHTVGLPGSPGNTDCTRALGWQWDGVRFEVLHPGAPGDPHDNNDSCVLRIEAGQHSLLLAGDIERPAEQELVRQYGPALHSTILLAPHHGSRSSSSAAFLEAVRPQRVIVPAGYRNRYGHPHPEVLARYRATGSRWQITGTDGALRFVLGPEDPVIHATRPESLRYWHNRSHRID